MVVEFKKDSFNDDWFLQQLILLLWLLSTRVGFGVSLKHSDRGDEQEIDSGIYRRWSKDGFQSEAPLKAPGLDGMPPLFYQHYWDSVGKEITTSVIFLKFDYFTWAS